MGLFELFLATSVLVAGAFADGVKRTEVAQLAGRQNCMPDSLAESTLFNEPTEDYSEKRRRNAAPEALADLDTVIFQFSLFFREKSPVHHFLVRVP
ncbi:hypothetical protein B7463_g10695, partial [Scytalidium lignicola]